MESKCGTRLNRRFALLVRQPAEFKASPDLLKCRNKIRRITRKRVMSKLSKKD